MTIGQRIAQKRKERGQSQEALGESLGVSRQSVYKWESDSALPEIDKLIAMSRLFGVTVGWLLGVEETPAPGEGPERAPEENGGELNEAQLKMVEEIVDRYIAAQPKPPKKRRWPLALAAVAAVCLCWNLFSRLDTLRGQYNNLQISVANMRSDVNNQIYSITGRVEEVLKSQNSLTADYATEIVSADLAANTVTISARATPKTYTGGMTAVFQVDTGDGPAEYPGELGPGNVFSATITCELTDSIKVSVVFITGDVRATQLLYVYACYYTNSLPAVSVYANVDMMWRDLDKNGDLVWRDAYAYISWNTHYSAAAVYDVTGVAEIREIRVGLFCNKKLVAWLESCERPEDIFRGGGWEDSQFYRLTDCTLTPAETDVFSLAAVVTDEYGRETVCESLPRSMVRDGELQHVGDSEMTAAGIDLEDWWNSPWDYE